MGPALKIEGWFNTEILGLLVTLLHLWLNNPVGALEGVVVKVYDKAAHPTPPILRSFSLFDTGKNTLPNSLIASKKQAICKAFSKHIRVSYVFENIYSECGIVESSPHFRQLPELLDLITNIQFLGTVVPSVSQLHQPPTYIVCITCNFWPTCGPGP